MSSLGHNVESLHYSLRRYFVDDFYFRHVPNLVAGSRVLDLGGNKILKRGYFDIEQYDLSVIYSNLSRDKNPDVQGDADQLSFQDNCFDALICSELLEHVADPPTVLRETHRVLKRGGTLMICVPFLYPIHGDPEDFGRYTDSYWKATLDTTGFRIINIERQGAFWSVLSDMLRELVVYMAGLGRPKSGLMRSLINYAILWSRRKALVWDSQVKFTENSFYGKYTTGFGIIATKR